MTVPIIVNGAPQELTARPGQTLLDWLRDLGVTGPKLGCGEGACGACTVLIGSRPVQACQVDAASLAGQRITTVEGLAEDGILHPVQQAWLEVGALQCGYCTPGWLTGTAALLARTPHPDDARIDAELDGHVCRCCAYPRIRRAIHRAAELMEDPELLEPVPADAPAPASLAPGEPWDLARARPQSFARAMPEGLLTVVADDVERSFNGPDDAWVHVGADGSITAFTGKVEAGQGTRTALALLVAEELAVPPSRVRLAMADTDVSPFDLGTFGSRGMPHAAPPLRTAAAAAFRLADRGGSQAVRTAARRPDSQRRDDRGPGRRAERELRRPGGRAAPGGARPRGCAGDARHRLAVQRRQAGSRSWRHHRRHGSQAVPLRPAPRRHAARSSAARTGDRRQAPAGGHRRRGGAGWRHSRQ